MDITPLPLYSERLNLRRLSPRDLAEFQAYRTDPEIARLQGWSMQSDEVSLAFLKEMSQADFFVPGQWFQLGVALRGSDQLIGDIGVCVQEDEQAAEIGFSIHGAHHSKGYGTEAVGLAIGYIFGASQASRIIAYADVRNIASWRVLEKVGMHRLGTRTCEYKGEVCDEHMYELIHSPGGRCVMSTCTS